MGWVAQPPQRLQCPPQAPHLCAFQLQIVDQKHRDGEFILRHHYTQPFQALWLLPFQHDRRSSIHAAQLCRNTPKDARNGLTERVMMNEDRGHGAFTVASAAARQRPVPISG